jgi:DNA-binding response OmpR family regulator
VDAAVLLLIGRSRGKRSARTKALEKRYRLLCATTGAKAAALANGQRPDIVILDAISLRTPGDRICQSLRAALGDVPIIHIHPGPKERVNSPADVVLLEPFTQRKLTNHIERLLKLADDEIITCGPFMFNVARRTLSVDGHETQLTPKQAILLELFMRAPGEVLDRKSIMEKVWQTDYMGDTRTLDVHIRWIRQAIELDPGNPRYLKTVRGVGYCFELPTEEMVIVPAK